MAHIVAKLVFLLISKHWKRSDSGDELIVSKCLKAGNRAGRRTERERERKTEILIARLRQVQSARPKYQRGHPVGAERVLIADHQIQIVIVRSCSRGRQRGLLDQGIAGDVAIGSGSE